MGGQQLWCDFCGSKIFPLDFHQGRAVVVARKNYCADCMTATIRRGKERRAAGTPRVASPASSSRTPAPASRVQAPRVTRRLKIGEHGCGLFASEEERRAQLGPYIREGLDNGEKVLLFLKTPTPEKILGDFRGVGLEVQSYLRSGQLEIIPISKILGHSDKFVPSELAARLRQAADRAIASGYTGLRIAGEMTWALSSLFDIDRLVEYEMELTVLAVQGKCTSLCQYNIYRFEASSLQKIRTSHPFVFAKGTAETVLRELAPTH
ncbi:MAG TPA: MEDS domain-containing protein [Planctomycetota bacterium]|nr:MEDS domain-containing protein [Planctomycetota bacterium]